jgi:S-adenosylmethionine hydrolase
MRKLIVVSDWASDTLASQEVRTAVEGFLNDSSSPNISFVASAPSTIHTAFLLYQLVEVEERYGHPLETVFFQNTDPRIQSEQGVELSQGAEFIVLRLNSGMYVCGPNAGYDFSMLKPKIEEVYVYRGLDKGSQFRSRDLYSRVCAHLMDEIEDELELEEIPSNIIPGLIGNYIGHIDNFGNIKTTITLEQIHEHFQYDDEVTLQINNVQKKARLVKNLFGGTPGELVLYPGSSGTKDNPFMEITVWRHFTENEISTGVHAFNNPLPGMPIEIIRKK